MTRETAPRPPSGSSPPHPVVRRLREAMPAADLAVVGDPAHRDAVVGSLERFWRERLQAITGLGLPQPSSQYPLDRRSGPAPDDGARPLSYLASGDPAGRRLVFVHGTPGDAADWAAYLHAAPAGQHRLAIDRPGFGQSGPGAP